MCGILGQFSTTHPIDPELFNQKRDTLTHRGPDDGYSWFSEDGFTALGFRRLSFLDLSVNGRQPMVNEDGKLHLMCNGEIYNYVELREELIGLGHQFSSKSDAEVILHGYEQWGVKILERMKGMFAFSLWDEKTGTLLLARDRFGIKPLYYGWLEGSFYFASELKAIVEKSTSRPKVNLTAISDYLNYRFVPTPNTIWEGLYKVPPAHYLEITIGEIKQHKANPSTKAYWQLPFKNIKADPQEAVEEVNHLLFESVQTHLRSDVPIGSFLSGGYDSSALVYYMKKAQYNPNTFAIGFDNWKESEDQYAQMVADHLNVPFYKTIVGSEQLGLLDKLVYHYDEPIADISIIPTFLVSQLASQHNKAVFSGEGADEMFGGYWWQKKITNLPVFQKLLGRLGSTFNKTSNFFVEEYAEAMSMGRFNEKNLPNLLHPRLHPNIPQHSDWFYAQFYDNKRPPLKAFQYMDMKSFMGELVLVKIDRASMANSLEVRVPFLDHELFEWVYQLSVNAAYRKDQTKFLLQENIKGHLPEAILDRPKQGFVGPDKYYMDIEWYAGILRSGNLIKDEIVQKTAVEKLIEEQKHWELWKLTVLEKWWKRWVG